MSKLKHKEDEILKYIDQYIRKTYTEHYQTVGGIQVIDVWQALGIDEETYRSNIIKYSMRYKYKDGANLKDLMKIIHYTILLIARNHSDEVNNLLKEGDETHSK